MCKVYLTVDPQTYRGLYDNESKFLGLYNSVKEAAEKLGALINFCSIRSVCGGAA